MRRVLVTGGNKGIGLAIVEAILSEHDDTLVFMGSRDLDRGQAAASQLISAHPGWSERLQVVELDVSKDASVSSAATQLRAQCLEPHPLYGLVNNAGVGGDQYSLNDVLQVNTLGVRRACEAFRPLVDPDGGRIVNITSAAGPSFVAKCSPEQQRFLTNPAIEWPALEAFISDCLALDGDTAAFEARGLSDGAAYGLSKACANAYTLLLARQNPNLHVNACTPGFIETDMTRRHLMSQGKTAEELGLRPPKDGARSAMFLLFSELEGNGRYYGSDAKRSPLDRYRAPGSEPYRGD